MTVVGPNVGLDTLAPGATFVADGQLWLVLALSEYGVAGKIAVAKVADGGVFFLAHDSSVVASPFKAVSA